MPSRSPARGYRSAFPTAGGIQGISRQNYPGREDQSAITEAGNIDGIIIAQGYDGTLPEGDEGKHRKYPKGDPSMVNIKATTTRVGPCGHRPGHGRQAVVLLNRKLTVHLFT